MDSGKTQTVQKEDNGSQWVIPRSRQYIRISFAFFLAGFVTFSLLYCTQPLLPEYTAEFGVSPAEASLAVSLATSALAFSIFVAGALSESLGRKDVMAFSILCASLLAILSAFMPYWSLFLALRLLQGIVLGGVPAVAMAYLAEEIHPKGLGLAMGQYIAGTALGGMMGRVLIGAFTDWFGWRYAIGFLGGLNLVCSAGFIFLLPASRNFIRKAHLPFRYHKAAWKRHILDNRLKALFASGFIAMGVFVTVYNYIGFRLTQSPYQLTQTQVGLIFLIYISGMIASSVAGSLADRLGRGHIMLCGVFISLFGILISLNTSLVLVIIGIVLITVGFFVTHTVASGWVGQLARGTKGHASSLYLLFYYLGSSLIGSSGGWMWDHGGWNYIVLYTLILLSAGLVLALYMFRREYR